MSRTNRATLSIGTVLFACCGAYRTADRLDAMAAVIREARCRIDGRAILVLPSGWVKATKGRPASNVIGAVVSRARALLRPTGSRLAVCVGVNGRRTAGNARDQLVLVVTAEGLVGAARKFYEAPGERIDPAETWDTGEEGCDRIVRIHGKRFYLGVCYDLFGIKRLRIPRPSIDGVLAPVHGFYSGGTNGSGDVLFARHGLAGAAREWRLPIFAAATFFDRPVPRRWPSGVAWRGGARSTTAWTYAKNALRPTSTWRVDVPGGWSEVRMFKLTGRSRSEALA